MPVAEQTIREPVRTSALLTDLGWIARGLRARVGLLALLCTTGALISVGTALVIVPLYRAEARVLVTAPTVPVDLARPSVTASAAERLAVIQQRLMVRRNLLDLADRLDLFAGQADLSPADRVDALRDATAIEPISYNTNPRYRGPTLLTAFTIAVRHRDPETAARIANALAEIVVARNGDDRANRAAEVHGFFAAQVTRLADELADLESRMAAIRAAGEIHRPERRAALRRDLDQARAAEARLRTRMAALSADPSPASPDRNRLAQRIETQLADMVARAQGIDRELRQSADAEMRLTALQHRHRITQTHHADALQKRADAAIGAQLETGNNAERFELLEQAYIPESPQPPHRSMIAMVGFALAAGLAMVVVVIVEYCSRVIRKADDLERLLDIQPVITIPRIVVQTPVQSRRARTLPRTAAVAIAGAICLSMPSPYPHLTESVANIANVIGPSERSAPWSTA